MRTYDGGIASLATAGLYDFEVGVRVVTANREHCRCNVGKVTIKDDLGWYRKVGEYLADHPGVEVSNVR